MKITDDMVERAAEAIMEIDLRIGPMLAHDLARAALEAARDTVNQNE